MLLLVPPKAPVITNEARTRLRQMLFAWGFCPEPTTGLTLCAGGGFVAPNAELPWGGSLVPREGQGRGACQQGSVE